MNELDKVTLDELYARLQFNRVIMRMAPKDIPAADLLDVNDQLLVEINKRLSKAPETI